MLKYMKDLLHAFSDPLFLFFEMFKCKSNGVHTYDSLELAEIHEYEWSVGDEIFVGDEAYVYVMFPDPETGDYRCGLMHKYPFEENRNE